MENDEKMPLFTRLNDAIDGKINAATQYIAKAAEDKEGISDDIVRGGLRTLGFVANLPVIKQIGQLEEGLVSQVGKLAEQQDLIDPRSFTYSTRIGTAFIPYFGAAKAVPKVAKAAKSAKVFVKAKQAESAAKKVVKATKEKYGDLKLSMMKNIDDPKNPFDDFGPEGPRGGATDEQIMQAYRERLGELDLDPFKGKTPEQTSRADVASIVNPESDLNLFKNTGEANIRRIKSNFTENELRQLKSFENHHNVPLKQSGWLVYGLPSDELAKTQFYLAQQGVKGGNVLEQIRIYPEGIHDAAHELGERIIGQMRKRQGRSIEKILGDLDPADYAKIQTFEGRKQYIDKFISGITEIETKINKILDALYANRLNDDTALEALIDINANVDDPKVLGILDDLLKQIDKDPFIQKPLDDAADVKRLKEVTKEQRGVVRSVDGYLRGVLERNRQKFSKYSTFDEALDAAEKMLEDDKGQRSIFYDVNGSEQYIPFAEQAERLAGLLFENK